MNGFINLLKPAGMNSAVAVSVVKRLLPKGTKVGHMGTLDPAAAGVLPIGVGFGARLFDYVIDKEKEYLCELFLGVQTDTQDADGRVLDVRPVQVSRENVEALFPRFTGDILQTPPAYSAVMKNGKKLYQLARAGADASVGQRAAHVARIELVDQLACHRYLLRIACGRGTYIRTILHDMGQLLGCGAYCPFLLRTRTGAFSLENAVLPEDLEADRIPLLPADGPILHFPRVVAGKKNADKVRNGNPISLSALEAEPGAVCAQQVRVYLGDCFAGIGKTDGKCLVFRAVLPPDEIGKDEA